MKEDDRSPISSCDDLTSTHGGGDGANGASQNYNIKYNNTEKYATPIKTKGGESSSMISLWKKCLESVKLVIGKARYFMLFTNSLLVDSVPQSALRSLVPEKLDRILLAGYNQQFVVSTKQC